MGLMVQLALNPVGCECDVGGSPSLTRGEADLVRSVALQTGLSRAHAGSTQLVTMYPV